MDGEDEKRAALKAWLEAQGQNPNSIARKAGVSVSSIYNFLSGASKSLSSGVLQKLAEAAGTSVDAILTGTIQIDHVTVTHRIGAGGRMFDLHEGEELTVPAPPGVSRDGSVAAAIVDGDGLHPIPDGWAVFYKLRSEDPAALVGKLAVVRYRGGGASPVVRQIRRSAEPGLYSLQAFNGTMIEGVEIIAAHAVVSFSQP